MNDLSYLQGRNAATDRAWQIEVERWRSEGRLAEHIGAAELGWDRFARRVRLDDTARKCFTALDDDTRAWVTSYVEGVNSVLGDADAPEFAATGTRPGRWQPWSPLGVFLVQHILFGTFPTKLWRAHAAGAGSPADGSGSNAWAVAGQYIAGDPHRVLELPGIYQQVRLSCPEFDVAGFAFPGVPGTPHFGHAGSVAWAVTNAMADYQDVYREQLRRSDGRVQARSADGWADVPSHTETILVAGADPVEVEVIETPRGPVFDTDLSLRVPARAERDLGFSALLPLLRAKTVADVAAAFERWVEPVNSVLTGDSSGAVLSLVAGRVPLRDHRNRQTPVPAWDPAFAWHGYADMPRRAVATVVNANDSREGDTAELGVDFAAPHRAARISALLSDGAQPAAVHMDDLLPSIAGLLGGLAPVTAGGQQLRDRLLAWDGRMAADSRDAGAFAAWRTALVHRLAGHPDLAPLLTPGGSDPLFAPWTDPIGRIGRDWEHLAARYPDVAAAALDETAAGPDPGTWGSRHVLAPIHLIPATALGRTVELSGDNDCVLATASVPGVSDACRRGPVARYVWDLSDRSRSRWIVPFGASGRPGSPHFADQLPLWASGDLIPLVTDWPALRYTEDVPGLGTLELVPVDPAAHAEVMHDFVTQRHTKFWGMSDWTVDQVREIYEFVATLTTHHAYLIRLGDRPIGIFQTYEPAADPVGERYPARPGDIGMHLLLAPGRRPPRGLLTGLTPALVRFLLADPAKDRVVVEPDVRNDAALRRLRALGFTFDDEIDMPDKRAQLAFITRAALEASHRRPAPPPGPRPAGG